MLVESRKMDVIEVGEHFLRASQLQNPANNGVGVLWVAKRMSRIPNVMTSHVLSTKIVLLEVTARCDSVIHLIMNG